MSKGWVAFAIFYAAIGINRGHDAAQVPASTHAGVAYAGIAWPLVDLLPWRWTAAICRDWCFNFKD